MKINLLVCLILLNFSNVFAQHSAKLLNFSSQLKFVDSTKIETKHKNGNLKEVKTIIRYEYNGFIYSYKTGLNVFYYSDNLKYSEIKYDFIGNVIYDKYYNQKGNLYKEIITTEIETNAENFVEFLKNKKLTIISYEKEYTSNDYVDMWLYKEGKRINGKKKGIWKEYLKEEVNGKCINWQLRKEKEF